MNTINSIFFRSYEVCNYLYKTFVSSPNLRAFLPATEPIPPEMFCAGSNSNPDIGTDNGDSGGPVFIKKRLPVAKATLQSQMYIRSFVRLSVLKTIIILHL